MDNKRRFYRLLEFYLNDYNKESVESYYGKGSRIKIRNVGFTQKTKSVVLEVTIVLGEIISETVMVESMAEALISEALVYFFPELSVNIIYSWDS